MELAPPPAPGSRVQELGDRLVIRFRPRGSRWEVGFLTCFLVAMILVALETLGQAAGGFEIVWTCGWLAGGCAVLLALAWKLAGHEILTVTPGRLEVRKEIGRFARTRRFDAALVRNVGPARFPADEESPPRDDFCLRLVYGTKPVRIGEGMERREAEEVANRVLASIRARDSWPADAHVFYDRLDDDEPWAASPARIDGVHFGLAVSVTIFCIVVAVLWVRGDSLVAPGGRDAPRAPAADPRSVNRPPSPSEFDHPHAFAAAATLYALRGSGTTPFGPPACAGRWRAWSCTVLARRRDGPYAFRTMPYRCSAKSRDPQDPAAYPVVCGPADPPPLPGSGS